MDKRQLGRLRGWNTGNSIKNQLVYIGCSLPRQTAKNTTVDDLTWPCYKGMPWAKCFKNRGLLSGYCLPFGVLPYCCRCSLFALSETVSPLEPEGRLLEQEKFTVRRLANLDGSLFSSFAE
jgi:hypothetical protein